jgi:hypothetical protein
MRSRTTPIVDRSVLELTDTLPDLPDTASPPAAAAIPRRDRPNSARARTSALRLHRAARPLRFTLLSSGSSLWPKGYPVRGRSVTHRRVTRLSLWPFDRQAVADLKPAANYGCC